MAANPNYEAEIHALREELGAIRGILAMPEVHDAVQRVRKGKGKEEVVAGPMLPPVYEEEPVFEGEGSEPPRRKAERLARTYATPEYRRMDSNKERNLRKRGRSRHGREHQPRRSRRLEYTSSSSSSRERTSRKKRTFKAGDKDIKFETFNGRRNTDRALAFIRQFDVAFAEESFTEKSKLRHAGMYLKGMASDWWLTKILEGKKPRSWEHFKSQFFKQFLPRNFEKDVRQEWDWIKQDEGESVSSYMDEFWTTLLKVTPFLKISEKEKMRKFESGLHAPIRKSLKVYPNRSLRRMMESAMVAEELHENKNVFIDASAS